MSIENCMIRSEEMKCLAVLGSPNATGFGGQMIKTIENQVNTTDISISFDIFNVGEKEYRMCKGCTQCFISGKCTLTESDGYDFYDKLIEYDALMFVVPSYIHQMPAILKNCFDRMASKMHEFPLLGKKVMVITYSMSNGEEELRAYIAGVMTSLGAEVVGAYTFNRCRDDKNRLLSDVMEGLEKMKYKIENHKFAVTKSQEQLYRYIRKIVSMEIENNVVSYKQKRWKKLMEYNSLVEYLRYAST